MQLILTRSDLKRKSSKKEYHALLMSDLKEAAREALLLIGKATFKDYTDPKGFPKREKVIYYVDFKDPRGLVKESEVK